MQETLSINNFIDPLEDAELLAAALKRCLLVIEGLYLFVMKQMSEAFLFVLLGNQPGKRVFFHVC